MAMLITYQWTKSKTIVKFFLIILYQSYCLQLKSKHSTIEKFNTINKNNKSEIGQESVLYPELITTILKHSKMPSQFSYKTYCS